MYQDTGLYRNQQYAKASTVLLQTMYEEIPILWDQEMKYRPSFSAAGDTVTLPVICQKICGVKDGNASQYWLDSRSSSRRTRRWSGLSPGSRARIPTP